MRKEGGGEMNHVNHTFRGDCIRFFPETMNISKSSIVVNGARNALGDVKNNGDDN